MAPFARSGQVTAPPGPRPTACASDLARRLGRPWRDLAGFRDNASGESTCRTGTRGDGGWAMASGSKRVVAVDVGGTFTDVCVLDQASGELEVAKVASTADPIDGVIAGVEQAGVDLAETALFCHGTTVATNALITRRLPKAAMVCTHGLPRRGRDRPRHPRRPVGRLQGQRRALHPPPRPARGDRARRPRAARSSPSSTRTRRARSRASSPGARSRRSRSAS